MYYRASRVKMLQLCQHLLFRTLEDSFSKFLRLLQAAAAFLPQWAVVNWTCLYLCAFSALPQCLIFHLHWMLAAEVQESKGIVFPRHSPGWWLLPLGCFGQSPGEPGRQEEFGNKNVAPGCALHGRGGVEQELELLLNVALERPSRGPPCVHGRMERV